MSDYEKQRSDFVDKFNTRSRFLDKEWYQQSYQETLDFEIRELNDHRGDRRRKQRQIPIWAVLLAGFAFVGLGWVAAQYVIAERKFYRDKKREKIGRAYYLYSQMRNKLVRDRFIYDKNK